MYTHTDQQTDRDRDRDSEIEIEIEIERPRPRPRQRQGHGQRQRHRQRERQRQRQRQTHLIVALEGSMQGFGSEETTRLSGPLFVSLSPCPLSRPEPSKKKKWIQIYMFTSTLMYVCAPMSIELTWPFQKKSLEFRSIFWSQRMSLCIHLRLCIHLCLHSCPACLLSQPEPSYKKTTRI